MKLLLFQTKNMRNLHLLFYFQPVLGSFAQYFKICSQNSAIENYCSSNFSNALYQKHTQNSFFFSHSQEACQVTCYFDRQPEVTRHMRAVLVDWMVEVQENFELNHETLYLAVKLVDHYLMVKTVPRDILQLLGASGLFIACKFDVSTELFFCQQNVIVAVNVFRTITHIIAHIIVLMVCPSAWCKYKTRPKNFYRDDSGNTISLKISQKVAIGGRSSRRIYSRKHSCLDLHESKLIPICINNAENVDFLTTSVIFLLFKYRRDVRRHQTTSSTSATTPTTVNSLLIWRWSYSDRWISTLVCHCLTDS